MPGIGSVEILSETESQRFERRYPDSLRRPSPDNHYELVLSRPAEIGMGADVWGDVRLLRGQRDVTDHHPALANHFGLSFAGVGFYYPWDRSSTKLTVPLMGRGPQGEWINRIAIYDVTRASYVTEVDDLWCSGINWSPIDDQVLLTHDEAEVVTPSGDRRRLPSPSRVGDAVVAAWTPNGRNAVISPPVDEEPSKPERLVFIDLDTTEVVVECPLDPVELLPYDSDRLRGSLDELALYDPDNGPPFSSWVGDWAEVATLRHWIDALYEPLRGTLLLCVYRPTYEIVTVPGPPRPVRSLAPLGKRACVISKRWVRVTLTD